MVLFSLRNGLYCMPKWGILQSEEIPLKYNYLIFNTLRRPLKIRVFAPEESQSANTRLFFGVYRETHREKSKSGYKLKVAHIGFIYATGNEDYQ